MQKRNGKSKLPGTSVELQLVSLSKPLLYLIHPDTIKEFDFHLENIAGTKFGFFEFRTRNNARVLVHVNEIQTARIVPYEEGTTLDWDDLDSFINAYFKNGNMVTFDPKSNEEYYDVYHSFLMEDSDRYIKFTDEASTEAYLNGKEVALLEFDDIRLQCCEEALDAEAKRINA